MKHNTFGKGSKRRAINGGNDEYYTDPGYAFHCCKMVKSRFYRFKIDTVVEPSAGNGSFYKGMKLLCGNNKPYHMYDIAPKKEYIDKRSFFDVSIGANTLVIGNPPFGFASTLAIKFFNHAANQKAKIIAFILPRTFKKDSIKNRLNLNYKLSYEEDCPRNSFLLENNKYNVPCVFQVWVYTKKRRNVEDWDVNNKWIEYTTPENADFCIRRVGGRAGQVLENDILNYSKQSTYFCKEKIKGAKNILKQIDFSEEVNSTAGVRSLSKREIHKSLYNSIQKGGLNYGNDKKI